MPHLAQSPNPACPQSHRVEKRGRAARAASRLVCGRRAIRRRRRRNYRPVLNKQVVFDLGISEVTVKLHRGSAMRKMQAASVGELIRAWEALSAGMREARAA